MIELFEKDLREDGRQSSKGNQLKWQTDGRWYKADYMGYEGFSEYVVSELLCFSTLKEGEYVRYRTEEIAYRNRRYTGCSSRNFLPEGWQLITLERLFQTQYGESLYRSVFQIEGTEERLRFLVSQVERITGLTGLGNHIARLLTIDAVFLNEDRHMHNIALLLDPAGEYHLCPVFDHGAALLSDTAMEYPMSGEVYQLTDTVRAKTISPDFEEQLDAAENLYGQQITFSFSHRQVEKIINEDRIYPEAVHRRVQTLIFEGMRKYPYLFQIKD